MINYEKKTAAGLPQPVLQPALLVDVLPLVAGAITPLSIDVTSLGH